jgi:hypothetical protein
MKQTHKWNKSWKFDDATENIINSVEGSFDVSESVKRMLRARQSASGRVLTYTIVSNDALESGAGFWFPSLTLSPHRLDKRKDIIEAIEAMGITEDEIIG